MGVGSLEPLAWPPRILRAQGALLVLLARGCKPGLRLVSLRPTPLGAAGSRWGWPSSGAGAGGSTPNFCPQGRPAPRRLHPPVRQPHPAATRSPPWGLRQEGPEEAADTAVPTGDHSADEVTDSVVRFLLGPGADEAPPQPEPRGQKAEARPGLGGDRPCPSSLVAPELHTCLARAEEARAAAQQGFDARRATRELLATSFVARCSVEGRAAAGMNIPREQPLYQGLVSLQVPAEEVLSSALQEKLALVRTQPESRRELDPEGPDLLMFYEPPELFAETPYLGVEGLPPLRLQPHGRPPAAPFLMFRKLQQWDA